MLDFHSYRDCTCAAWVPANEAHLYVMHFCIEPLMVDPSLRRMAIDGQLQLLYYMGE
jgi:hypothetical protein